jgi:DNA replication protein DnaC
LQRHYSGLLAWLRVQRRFVSNWHLPYSHIHGPCFFKSTLLKLLLGNAGVGKSHIAQAIGMAAIHAGFRVLYREAHVLFEDLLLASATGERTDAIAMYSEIPLLIIDDLGMRKLPANAAEDLLEIVMRRYERTSTILTSNRPLGDWPQLFGDTPAVAAFLDRLMHHSHLIEIRGKSYRLHDHSLTARNRKAKNHDLGARRS